MERNLHQIKGAKNTSQVNSKTNSSISKSNNSATETKPKRDADTSASTRTSIISLNTSASTNPLLDGTYNEQESQKLFAEALANWRGDSSHRREKSSNIKPEVASIEIQTDK